MATLTVNYNFNLPAVGGDVDNWGDLLNANWEALDALLLSDFARIGAANIFTTDQRIQRAGSRGGLVLERTDTPAGALVIADLQATGRDSAGSSHGYGILRNTIMNPTDGSEAAIWDFHTSQGGTLASRMALGSGLYMTGATGGDMGAGTLNATNMYVNGIQVPTLGFNTFTNSQRIQLSDDGAASGPFLTLDRVSASPAANDVLGAVRWNGRDSANVDTLYAGIFSQILDPVDGSEDGRMLLYTVQNGLVGAAKVNIDGGLWMQNALGSDKGIGSINAQKFFFNGVEVPYEEGTFTPNLIGETTTGTATYSSRSGAYIRVGKICHFVIQIAWSAHTGSGSLQVNGLPFNRAGALTPISIYASGIATPVNRIITYGLLIGSTAVGLYEGLVGGGATTRTALSSSGSLYIAGTYQIQ